MIHEIRSSSSSSTLSIPRKVCLVFPAPGFEYGHGRDIYILDLNTDLDNNLSSPTITIRVVDEAFRSAAFYVLGSTLYVFQGNDGQGRPRGKRVFSYDFSGHEGGGGVITLSDKKDFTCVCHMNDIKIRPLVIPTPDGKKFVVFSTQLKSLDNSTSTSNFELFDPFAAEPNCKILPDLFRSPPLSNFIHFVRSFSFLNNDVLYVQTTLSYPLYTSGMFILNLNLVDQGSCWESFYIPEQLRNAVEFKLIGDDICLTPEEGLRINVPGFVVEGAESSNKSQSYELPLRPLSDDGFSPPHEYDVFLQRCIALLDNHPHDRLFCVLSKWVTEEEVKTEENVIRVSQEDEEENKSLTFRYVPHVILDVYRCNLHACKKGMLELEEKQQREKFKAELEEKQLREQLEKLELEEKQQREKLESDGKNKIISEMVDFEERVHVFFNRLMADMDDMDEGRKKQKAVDLRNKASMTKHMKQHSYYLVPLREKFNGLVALREKIKRNWKNKNTDKQLLVIERLVRAYGEKRFEFENLVEDLEKQKKINWKKEELREGKFRSKVVSTELLGTVLTELREEIKSNKMKSNVASPELPGTVSTKLREKIMNNSMKSNVVVSTELPGTELVKSFHIEFDPQPPPSFILHRIFPLHNFFSIPT